MSTTTTPPPTLSIDAAAEAARAHLRRSIAIKAGHAQRAITHGFALTRAAMEQRHTQQRMAVQHEH